MAENQEKQPLEGASDMFDIRLACLMEAINKNWAELEAREENGTLVVRVKASGSAELRAQE
jgi:hypothetical protein